jgi:hypothetical protein
MLARSMEPEKPNVSVWRYLRAFTYDSLAKMSGPLRVPFAGRKVRSRRF